MKASMKNKIPTMSKLIATSIVLISEPAYSFRSSTIPSPTIVKSFESIDPTSQSIVVVKKRASQEIPKYDLGIGKNRPVGSQNGSIEEDSLVDSRLDPTQFLIEHESVRPYPSPLNLTKNDVHRKDPKNHKRKNLPTVQNIRHAKDVLHIQNPNCIGSNNSDNDNSIRLCLPIIAPINDFSTESNEPVAKLDVNTIWVEMMLYHEQSKML